LLLEVCLRQISCYANISYQLDGSRSNVGSAACGVRMRKILFPLGVHATVFQAEISLILTHAKDGIERNYTGRKFKVAQSGNFMGP
jgi:hypothetical protein